MNVKCLTQQVLSKQAFNSPLTKSTTIVLNLSRSKVTLEEAATIAFNARRYDVRYNCKRDLLMIEFESTKDKLRYMKKIPQWLWNRGCVLWDCSAKSLDKWVFESRV
ncbi:MAG: hypothetical protein GXP14_06885 [Gammaproteobacteria bacterium]|nr:hypothetical protein [Gammaproteobacteria bacterium]